MTINRTSIAAEPITENTKVGIKLLLTRPSVTDSLVTPIDPNVMFGYYDPTRGVVELYMSDPSGYRYLKVI